ncbi:hypothetical protein NSND_60128 [Nitrospira sp. ND1]|nr:hypothetical protein NSND_60128 [Nitrospira sp. ND1]
MDRNGSPSLVLIQACDERPVFLMRGPAVETYRAVPLAFSVGPVVLMGVRSVPQLRHERRPRSSGRRS